MRWAVPVHCASCLCVAEPSSLALAQPRASEFSQHSDQLLHPVELTERQVYGLFPVKQQLSALGSSARRLPEHAAVHEGVRLLHQPVPSRRVKPSSARAQPRRPPPERALRYGEREDAPAKVGPAGHRCPDQGRLPQLPGDLLPPQARLAASPAQPPALPPLLLHFRALAGRLGNLCREAGRRNASMALQVEAAQVATQGHARASLDNLDSLLDSLTRCRGEAEGLDKVYSAHRFADVETVPGQAEIAEKRGFQADFKAREKVEFPE